MPAPATPPAANPSAPPPANPTAPPANPTAPPANPTAQYPQNAPPAYPYPPGPYPPGYPYPPYGYPGGPPYYSPYGPVYQPPAPPVPRPTLPDDAAVQGSPFIDALMAAYDLQDRFSDYLTAGIEVGGYIVRRVRVAGRALLPLQSLHDDGPTTLSLGEQSMPSASPAFLYSASAGVVVTSSKTFVLSPGLSFLRSNVPDYGTLVGVSLPFEWVTTSGLRLGTEVNIGRALGGYTRLQCFDVSPTGGGCAAGTTRTVDRSAGTAFVLDFHLGWGFGHPDPVMK